MPENNPELRIIAHYILNEDARQPLFAAIKGEYFASVANARIFTALTDMKGPAIRSEGGMLTRHDTAEGYEGEIHVQDVVNYVMEQTDYYESVGGEKLKGRLEEIIALPLGSWFQDLKTLKDNYHKRELSQALQMAAEIAAEEGEENELASIMERLVSLQEEIEYDPLAGVAGAQNLIEALDTIEEMPDFVPTRYPNLNRAMGYDPRRGGLAKGSVHSLIGAPGSGKSTFTISLLVGFIQEGFTVAYANYEIAEFLWNKFFYANCTGCNPLRIKDYDKEFREDSKKKFKKLMEEWDGRLYIKHSHASLFFEDIETWIRDVCKTTDVDVLIVDTLQSLEVGTRKIGARWQAYEYIMMRLERLALDLDVAILITGQENRDRIREGREEASIADTGGSISIEQKSAVVMHLIIPQGSTGDLDWVEVQITKNRVVGGQMVSTPIQFTYSDHYKGHFEYTPEKTEEDQEIERVAARLRPDPTLLD